MRGLETGLEKRFKFFSPFMTGVWQWMFATP